MSQELAGFIPVADQVPTPEVTVLCRCRLDGGHSIQTWPARIIGGRWTCLFDLRKVEDVSHWKPFPLDRSESRADQVIGAQ